MVPTQCMTSKNPSRIGSALNARREATAKFLRQLRRDLLAQETGDLLGLDTEKMACQESSS